MMPRERRATDDEGDEIEDSFARTVRPSSVGLVVIAHGSRRPEANADLFSLVRRLDDGRFKTVRPAFLELAEPTIVDAGAAAVHAGSSIIVLTPYFLSAGVHVVEDLETARHELIERFPDRVFLRADPLGPHPLLEEIIRLRVEQTTSRPAPSTDSSSLVE
jgi:sirohydrochlorin ferrochelatase